MSAPKTESSPRKAAPAAAQAAAKAVDAIRLLKDDHREVKAWFKEYEDLKKDADKQALADKICLALTVHTQIEEEIFYPAVRAEMDEDDLLDEAEVEHGSAKQLIAEIRRMKAGERLFDAKVKVLGEYVQHHVKEEETELFKEARGADLDLKGLGARLAQRKAALMAKGAAH